MFTLLMDLGKVAGKAIKGGVATYKEAKGDVTPERLATVILKDVNGWEPTVNKRKILTPPLRAKLAQSLAGLAYNIGAAEAGRELV